MADLVRAADNELFHTQLFDITSYVLDNDKSINQEIATVHQNNDYSWFYEQSHMEIPEELPHIMASATPPPFSFFQNLPSIFEIVDREWLRQHMVIYCTTLEKPGSRPRIGIESAAEQLGGAEERIQQYRKEKTFKFSVKTQESLKDGYKITNVGLLVAIQRPPRSAIELAPRIRAWALTLEADFIYMFSSLWDRDGNETSHSMRHACPWDVDALEYDGVNTHSPLSERVKGLEFGDDELQEIMVTRQQRIKESRSRFNESDKGKQSAKQSRARYHKSDKGKQRQKRYQQSDSRKRSVLSWKQSPNFAPAQARRIAKVRERALVLKQVEAGELEVVDEETEKLLASALKRRANVRKNNDAKAEEKSKHGKASRAALRQVKNGELDGNDPEVEELIRQAEHEVVKRRREAAEKKEDKALGKGKAIGGYFK